MRNRRASQPLQGDAQASNLTIQGFFLRTPFYHVPTSIEF